MKFQERSCNFFYYFLARRKSVKGITLRIALGTTFHVGITFFPLVFKVTLDLIDLNVFGLQCFNFLYYDNNNKINRNNKKKWQQQQLIHNPKSNGNNKNNKIKLMNENEKQNV